MKKAFSLIVLALSAIALVGCGSAPEETAPDPSATEKGRSKFEAAGSGQDTTGNQGQGGAENTAASDQ